MSRLETSNACCGKAVFKKVLIAVDGAEPAGWALKLGGNLADATGSAVALVHVIPGLVDLTPEFAMVSADLIEDREQAGHNLLQNAAAKLGAELRPLLLLKVGQASQQIIAAAREWGADLIVIGTHGRSAVAHMLLGSTAESVARHAHSPVLTVGCDPDQPKAGPCHGHGAKAGKAPELAPALSI
jgi:nucleotide-binding universal stress UspA family protein